MPSITGGMPPIPPAMSPPPARPGGYDDRLNSHAGAPGRHIERSFRGAPPAGTDGYDGPMQPQQSAQSKASTPKDIELELSRIAAGITRMEQEIKSLQSQLKNVDGAKMSDKEQAMNKARAAFENAKKAQIQAIEAACSKKRQAASDLLDTFPDLQTKEYMGKYELQSIESKLVELYPPSLIENYTCPSPVVFETEGDAFNTYVKCERIVAGMKSGTSLTGSMFDSVTSILNAATEKTGSVGKVLVTVLGVACVLITVAPMMFMLVYGAVL